MRANGKNHNTLTMNPAGTTVSGKRVSVIGAARSGVAVARVLKTKGASVFVSDYGKESGLGESISELRTLEIPFETGGHTDRALEADLIVISPGVPTGTPLLLDAGKREIPIVSEVEAASWFCTSPVIAITGTNGKTTTTTLVGRMLDDAKIKNAVAGNIGTAFSAILDGLNGSAIAVLEISSFQLDYITTFHPSVSVLLNITPDHLDRYEHSFEKYIASKCRIFENQTVNDILVYNHDDEVVREQVRRFASQHVRLLPFGIERRFDEGAYVENGRLVTVLGSAQNEIVETEQISIRGLHNLYNAMAATLASQAVRVKVPSLRATLKNFKGVEHRLEFVRELDGVKYINDSKGTNVDSVWYALQAYKEPLVVLIGGRDKGNDYSRLNEAVREHVKAIVAIGESAEKVENAFHALKKVVRANSMEEAVTLARGLATAGDIVLLSPACASFDWFRNYEHRGQVFKQIVRSLS